MLKDPLGPPDSNKLAAYRVRLAPSIPEPNMCQLKGLDLSAVTMTDFSPEIFHILLE